MKRRIAAISAIVALSLSGATAANAMPNGTTFWQFCSSDCSTSAYMMGDQIGSTVVVQNQVAWDFTEPWYNPNIPYVCSGNGCNYPFPVGSGLNSKYVGDKIVKLESAGVGDCISYQEGNLDALMSNCDTFFNQAYVIHGNWIISVGATNFNPPYDNPFYLVAHCEQPDCVVQNNGTDGIRNWQITEI